MNKRITFEATIVSKPQTDTAKFVRYLPTTIGGEYEPNAKTHKFIDNDIALFDQLEVGQTYQVTWFLSV
jgi:hypothetical protein